MLLRPLSPLLLSTALLLSACNCGEDSETTASSEAPSGAERTAWKGDPAVLDAIEALGDQGALVLVLRPSQWTALHQALAPWLAELPPEAAYLRDARGPEALLDLGALALGLRPGSIHAEGWDQSRPIVASFGEVPYGGPPGSVTPLLPIRDDWMPPVRHQLLVPASDAKTLTAALASSLEPSGKAWPALVEGHEHARAVSFERTTIALLPEKDRVRVVVLQAEVMGDQAMRLEHMKGRLAAKSAEVVRTPALSLAAAPGAVAAGWIRPWRMRPLAAWAGGMEVVRAIMTVSHGDRATAMSRGTQILLDTELLMTDAGADFDDAALALVADEGVVRLRSALSLTPESEVVFDAAGDGAGAAFPVKVDDAWLELMVRNDASAALAAAEVPPRFEAVAESNEIFELIQEGGVFSTLYVGLRHPLGLIRLADQMLAKEELPVSLDAKPTAVHLVWRGMEDEMPRVAVAAQWPEGASTAQLMGLVALAKTQRTFAGLKSSTGERAERPITLVGLGADPQEVFETSKPGHDDALLRMRVSLDRMRPWVREVEPQLAALLKGSLELHWHREDKALMGELAWSPAGAEIAQVELPVATGGKWDSPIGLEGDAKAVECLSDAGRGLAQGLRTYSTIESSQVQTVATTMLTEVEGSLRCAADDDATRDAAAGLRRMVVGLSVDVLVDSHQDAAALALLRQQCEQTEDAHLCERQEARAKLPLPALAQTDVPSECDVEYGRQVGDIDVRFDGKTIAIEGSVVGPSDFAQGLKDAIAAYEAQLKRYDETLDYPFPTDHPPATVGVAVDGSVTMATLRPLLTAMTEAGVERVVVALSRRSGIATTMAIDLKAEAADVAAALLGVPAGGSPPPAGGSPPSGGLPPTGAFPLRGARPPSGAFGMIGALPGDWALIEVGRAVMASRSTEFPEPILHASADPLALRRITDLIGQVYLYTTDDATWADVAHAVAGSCPKTTLVLTPLTPPLGVPAAAVPPTP